MMPTGHPLNNQQVETIITLYRKGLSADKIAELLNIDKTTVCKRLKRAGIPRRNRSDYRVQLLDESYFTVIDDERKAYWLGFLMADGFVSVCRHRAGIFYALGLKLAASDIEHLERFKKDLKTTADIVVFTTNYHPVGKKQARIQVYSKQLIEDLITHGCTPRKSLTLRFPTTVPEDMVQHFMRGYFDGDGSISFDKSTNSWYFGVEGTREFLSTYQDFLIKNCDVSPTKLVRGHGRQLFSLRYAGNRQVKSILDWLYSEATVYLQRKFDRYKQVCDLYGS